MFIHHSNGTAFRVVSESSRDALMARDQRIITSANGTQWHVGATRATGQRVSEPIAWLAHPGHCTKCPPASVVEIVSNWRPDDCWDPCHSEAVIRFGGELYRAHRVADDGLFFIRPIKYDGRLWTVRTFEEFPAMLAGRSSL